MNAKVYRSGIVEAPHDRRVEKDTFEECDSLRPEGRQGRSDAIFASPNLSGVLRWARANSMFGNITDPLVREITVNPDTVYVYSIPAYEAGSWRGKGFAAYWDSGVTLSEWLENEDSLDPTEWELLLGKEDIISVRNVSDKRLLEYCDSEYDRTELKDALSGARRALKWENDRLAPSELTLAA